MTGGMNGSRGIAGLSRRVIRICEAVVRFVGGRATEK